MKFFLQIVFIVRNEASYLLRSPRLVLSGSLLAFVPALYCVLYITSVWDPETKTRALPVAVVNLDRGVEFAEHNFNLGWEIMTRLEDGARFGYEMVSDEQKARTGVRQGKLAFAVIIPRDFSASAVPGAEADAGKVVIYTSQGNNYETAAIANRFAERLGREINESLNERRWGLALHTAAGSKRSVDRLHDAVGTLRANARDVSAGSAQTTTKAQALVGGARRLNEGVDQLTAEAKRLRAMPGAIDAARSGNSDLDELTKSSSDLATSASTFAGATEKNNQAIERLSAGIDLVAKALPGKVESPGGSPEGLARSVAPLLEIDAPVENSGSGFAANVVPGALWLGAAMAAFLIHVRVLPRHSQFFSRPAQVVGKIFLPACVALLQSLVVYLVVLYVLKIRVVNPWAFAFTLIVSSITFLSIVFALTKAFGDSGKGIAMFLLAVQLSSSGGILPVELSGGLFAQISPWLPLTWVVESIKASMFGAYGGAWQEHLVLVGLVGLAGFVLSCSVGRWRFVKSSAKRSTTVY